MIPYNPPVRTRHTASMPARVYIFSNTEYLLDAGKYPEKRLKFFLSKFFLSKERKIK